MKELLLIAIGSALSLPVPWRIQENGNCGWHGRCGRIRYHHRIGLYQPDL